MLGMSKANANSTFTNDQEKTTISNLLSTLIQCQLANGSNNNAQTHAHLFSYCSRLLASRLFPTLSQSDLHSLSNLLKKKMLKSGTNGNNSENILHLGKLLDAFHSNDLVTRKWSILYFFYTLSTSTSSIQLNESFNTFTHSNSGSVAVFSSPTNLNGKSFSVPSLLASNNTTTIESISTVETGTSSKHHRHSLVSTPSSNSTSTSTPTSNILNKSNRFMNTTPIPTPSTSTTTTTTTTNTLKTVRKSQVGKIIPSDLSLVRAVLSAMQMASSDLVNYNDSTSSFKSKDASLVLLDDILRLPSLFKQVSTLLSAMNTDSLLFQTLKACVMDDLLEYHSLASKIENYVNSLTTKRLLVWSQPLIVKLGAILSLLKTIHTGNSTKGHLLLNQLHRFSLYGDNLVSSMFSNYIDACSKTYFRILVKFIQTGLLEDPFLEFFCVLSNPSSLSWDAISLQSQYIPSFISSDFAKIVYITGKSKYFLFKLSQISPSSNADNTIDYDLKSMNRLHGMVNTEYKLVNTHLIDTLHSKFNLFDNFDAIKNYLLMAHGDFIYELLDSLSDELNKDASVLMRHSLLQKMDNCLRLTNAQYDPLHVLARVDVRLLAPLETDIGWDVFSLDYRMDGPLRIVFRDDLMILYLRLFNFLWRMKRVIYMCGKVWKRILSIASFPFDYGVLRSIIVFMGEIEDYVLVNVVEKSWSAFRDEIKGVDLETLLDTHAKYCKKICTGLFGNDEEIVKLMLLIFKDVIAYCTTLLNMCDRLEELRIEDSEKNAVSTVAGGWGTTTKIETSKKEKREGILNSIKTLGIRKEELQLLCKDKLGLFTEKLMKSDELTSLALRL